MKTALAQSNKDKLTKQMSIPNYETAIKEDVRAGNVEKVRNRRLGAYFGELR